MGSEDETSTKRRGTHGPVQFLGNDRQLAVTSRVTCIVLTAILNARKKVNLGILNTSHYKFHAFAHARSH